LSRRDELLGSVHLELAPRRQEAHTAQVETLAKMLRAKEILDRQGGLDPDYVGINIDGEFRVVEVATGRLLPRSEEAE
jgi:hypothetical protein